MYYVCATTKLIEMPPYMFFSLIGITFASCLFILLCMKYDFEIKRYSKIYLFSGIGLMIGAKIFGFLSGVYRALGNGEVITWETLMGQAMCFMAG
jgi:hypothetical protein